MRDGGDVDQGGGRGTVASWNRAKLLKAREQKTGSCSFLSEPGD